MQLQNPDRIHAEIQAAFVARKQADPQAFTQRINLSWSNWGFGLEDLATSARRLQANGVNYIELHGNHYGPDLGYKSAQTRKILADHQIEVAGVCGMFNPDNDLSSNRHIHRQAAIDYIRREADFCAEMGGGYLLIVPGAVGRTEAYDSAERERSLQSLTLVADHLSQAHVKGALEPIRAAEVSFLHTISEATSFIEELAHPGVQHINGDVFHMLAGEEHVGSAVMQAASRLVNLHLADSNRLALGKGCLDLDAVIMALYLIGFNQLGCYATAEPLGPGGAPYAAMHEKNDPQVLDELVRQTVTYFRQREEALLCL